MRMLSWPATLPQDPGSVRIFKAIHRVGKADVVFPLQVGKLVIVVASSGSVRKNFVQIGVSVMMKEGVAPRRIIVTHRATIPPTAPAEHK